VIQQIKDKFENLQYGNSQMGLVFVLFFIILVVLPISFYGMIFFTPISPDEVNFYSKFGAWFTALGAISTVINTIVVIYLMIWLHRKETNISLISYMSELRKDLVEIKKSLISDVEYFEHKQSDHIDRLYEYQYEPDGNEDLYNKEIKNLSDIIPSIKKLYSIFIDFKKSLDENDNINLEEYRSKSKIVNSLHERIVLNRPSIEYAKSFDDGYRNNDAEPKDIIEVAKGNSLKYIDEMIELLEEKAP